MYKGSLEFSISNILDIFLNHIYNLLEIYLPSYNFFIPSKVIHLYI